MRIEARWCKPAGFFVSMDGISSAFPAAEKPETSLAVEASCATDAVGCLLKRLRPAIGEKK
jgi:hypothetical protein